MTAPGNAGEAEAKPVGKNKYNFTKDNLPLAINLGWCKACNLCIALCPTQVFEPDRDGKPIQARPDACTQCTICWVHCPDFAIVSAVK